MQFKLPTLKYRRLKGDMIEIYKILTNRHDTRVNFNLKNRHRRLPNSVITESVPCIDWYGKTETAGLQSGECRMMIESVVLAQYINVTNRHTDTSLEQ